MAWNDSGNGKNPWDRGGQDGPPDLDKIIRDWQRKLSSLFGGGKRSGGGRSGDSGAPLVGILILVVLGWGATGFYTIDDAERGVVQRFGAYTETTNPGLRWHIPWPIEIVDKVNISAIERFSQTTSMLTSDENIILVDMVVQFRHADPMAFLFNVEDPVGTLADASESAIREVIGKGEMDYILGEGRAPIAESTQEVIQAAVDEYGTGITVTKVNLQDVNFPSQVEAAVQDAIKAREDKERLKFEADSYSNDILPKARGDAVRQVQDAEAYKDRVIADSQGEAGRFTALLKEYEKAPAVTRDRLYIDAIESVYRNSSKVLLDAEGGGNLLYLPVDKLIQQGKSGRRSAAPAEPPRDNPPQPDRRRSSDESRTRGIR
ncbi:MAG: FtsH protease activity modulator HflK [Gammaproteobacteria bacterium]|jgi:membrane protease subunit HflK|nr:FtsH protease activity modulator HflK [Gammaproteobacteria bacterium]MDP6616259.1 FtsH protease activity modulator HflK [Gammaproteobacteria bacterium]MDP6695434.1 FtsH protease activity modulator HflK [Gammaproteobacteria bacterium]MDP7041490.1 FtsH protease activity modulator HflK [Gammaproteobacteria bacterium]